MQGENIQDQHAAVDDVHLVERILNVADLGWRQLGIKHNQMNVVVAAKILQFLQLAAADTGSRIFVFLGLDHLCKGSAARRVEQARKLVEAAFALPAVAALLRHADENRVRNDLFVHRTSVQKQKGK